MLDAYTSGKFFILKYYLCPDNLSLEFSNFEDLCPCALSLNFQIAYAMTSSLFVTLNSFFSNSKLAT